MFRVAGLFLLMLALLSAPVSAQYTNVRVNNLGSTDPEEVTISINPTNPLNIAAGANITYCYYSMDGGFNWTEGTLTSSLGVWGDPCAVFDARGDLYFGHLSWPNLAPGDWLDQIVVQKSVNGGVSWSDGVGVGLNTPKDQDKEWLAVDMTYGEYHNNIYMAWTQFDHYGSTNPVDSSLILLSRSIDHGVSWSLPVRVSDIGGNTLDDDETVEGAVPAIGPRGEVYLSWAGHDAIFFDKSLDGGVTWGADAIIASQPDGWAFEVPGISRCNGFPVTLCDASTSPHRGNVYVMFSDQRHGDDDTDIFFMRSTDGGSNWTTPAGVVNESGPHHQFFPWACVDPVTGYIYIVFYDRRFTVGNATNVHVAMSQDGGVSFTDFKVSASSFTPNDGVFFGDYTNIAALNGKVYPIWMRLDGNTLSVWMAHVNIPVPTGIAFADPPPDDRVLLSRNYPNPFNPVTRIEFVLPTEMETSMVIYDVRGNRVATVVDRVFGAGPHRVEWNGNDLHGQPVGSGVYFCKLQAGGQTVTRKMTLLK